MIVVRLALFQFIGAILSWLEFSVQPFSSTMAPHFVEMTVICAREFLDVGSLLFLLFELS